MGECALCGGTGWAPFVDPVTRRPGSMLCPTCTPEGHCRTCGREDARRYSAESRLAARHRYEAKVRKPCLGCGGPKPIGKGHKRCPTCRGVTNPGPFPVSEFDEEQVDA